MVVLENDELVPLEFRVAWLLPIPALAMGAVIAAALLVAYFAFSFGFGVPLVSEEGGLLESTLDSVWLCLLVAYTFTSYRVASRGIEDDLRRAGAEPAPNVGTLPRPMVRRSRYFGAIGLAVGFFIINAVSSAQGYTMEAPWTALHETSFFLFLFLLFFWMLARVIVFTISGARYAAGFSSDDLEVDLLDLQPLNAFGRIGLRFALLWIVGVTFAVPMLLTPDLESTGVLVALPPAAVIATVALLIPVLGVRARVRSVKQAELARIGAAIRGDDAALSETRIADRKGQLSLADLIAYRGLVESAPEWPYDAPTLSRFVLYLLIPAASWVAAALVERGVDSLLR